MDTRTSLPLLASALALMFILSLACTLLGVGHRGLDTPLTHSLAGAAAIFFTLFMVSERYNPNPLLPRSLRHAYAVQVSLWISIFYAACAVPGFILQVGLMIGIYDYDALSILPVSIAVLLMVVAVQKLSKTLNRKITADKNLLLGFTVAAAGQGIIAMLPEGYALFPAMLLSAAGTGMVYQARKAFQGKLMFSTVARLNTLAAYASGAVTVVLLMMLLAICPGSEGFAHGFTFLTVFALAGMVTALMAEE